MIDVNELGFRDNSEMVELMERKLQILLVDDDVSILAIFKIILEDNGFQVLTAKTGQEALRIVDQEKFDLCIFDIVLPDIQGEDLVRKIRERGISVKIILITGFPSFRKCVDLLDIGVSEILMKPVSKDELLLSVKMALFTEQNGLIEGIEFLKGDE